MKNHARARRRARLLTFALVLLAAPSTASVPAAEPRASAADCVDFQKEDGEKELFFRASNACDRQLDCRLTYQLRCEDNERKVTSTSTQGLTFQLEPNSDRKLELSAQSCKQGWAINNVMWSCI